MRRCRLDRLRRIGEVVDWRLVTVQKRSPPHTRATTCPRGIGAQCGDNAATMAGTNTRCGTQGRTWLINSIQSASNIRQDASSLLTKRCSGDVERCAVHGVVRHAFIVLPSL